MIKITKNTMPYALIIPSLMTPLAINGMKRNFAPHKTHFQQQKKHKSATPIEATLYLDEKQTTPTYLSTTEHKQITSPLIINGKQPAMNNLMAGVRVYVGDIEWTKHCLPFIQQEIMDHYRAKNSANGISVISLLEQAAITKQIRQTTFPLWFPVKELYNPTNNASQLKCIVHEKETILTCKANKAEKGDFQKQLSRRLKNATYNSPPE